MRDFYARMRFLFRAAWRDVSGVFGEFWKEEKKSQGIIGLIFIIEWVGCSFIMHFIGMPLLQNTSCFVTGLIGLLLAAFFFCLFYLMIADLIGDSTLSDLTEDSSFKWYHFITYIALAVLFLFSTALCHLFLYNSFVTFYTMDAQASTLVLFVGVCFVALLLSLCLGLGLYLGFCTLSRARSRYCHGQAWSSDTFIHVSHDLNGGYANAKKNSLGPYHIQRISALEEMQKIDNEQQAVVQSLPAATLVSASGILLDALGEATISRYHDFRLDREVIYVRTDEMLFDYKDYIKLRDHGSVKKLSDCLDEAFAIKYVYQINFECTDELIEKNFTRDNWYTLDWLRGPYYYKFEKETFVTVARKLLGFGQRAMPLLAIYPILNEDWQDCFEGLCRRMLDHCVQHHRSKIAELLNKYTLSEIGEKLALYHSYAVIYRFAERVVRSCIAPNLVSTYWFRGEDVGLPNIGLPEVLVSLITDYSRDSQDNKVLHDMYEPLTIYHY